MSAPTGPEEHLRALVAVLQNAYSGEYAASLAYGGHAKSVSDPAERDEILVILEQELEHRGFVGKMLADLGSSPDPFKEALLTAIGTSIALFCRVGGWWAPMYGAGKLEAGNIVEYEVAARHAALGGRPEFVECLLHMAEVEWDHELYFRRKAESSVWNRLVPVWPAPPPRDSIRGRAEEYARPSSRAAGA